MPIAKIRIETESNENVSSTDNEKKMSKEEQQRLAVQIMMAKKVLNLSKQAMSKSVGMIGITTGDYTTQKNIENFIGLGENLISTGVAFGSNPYLGVAKVVADTINESFNLATRIIKENKQRIAEEQLQKRTGNSLTNGSRTGN